MSHAGRTLFYERACATAIRRQVIAVWYLAIGLGNNLAGQLSLDHDASNLQSLPLGAAVLLLRVSHNIVGEPNLLIG
ncbi:MAG: hypothetical protein ACJ8R9_11335 [Steroidobacteraceae bacterium]